MTITGENRRYLATLSRALLAVAICFSLPNILRADFILVGDNDPTTFPDNGGDIGGDLIIGVTEVGGMFFDSAPALDGPIETLMSENGTLGDGPDAIGAALLDDFGVRWEVGTKLSVGNEGQGTLDITDSANITVGSETIIGEAATGFGDVTLTGVGSLLAAEDLSVGQAGYGTVTLSSRASLRSNVTNIGSTDDGGNGVVTLRNRGTRWTVRDTFTVGGLTGTGRPHGRIEIQDDAVLQVEENAAMTVNPKGTIDIAGGTIRMLPQATNTIANNGLIQGHGFIDGGMTIGGTGRLRNAAAETQNGSTVTRPREYLVVAEAVENNGTIQTLGGAMEFEALVTNNNGIIEAKDAILEFRNSAPEDGTTDLQNEDLLVLGGDISVIGDIVNGAGGDIFTLDDTTLLIQGNLEFTSGIFGIATDGQAAPISVTGAADLSGATIDMAFSSDFSLTGLLLGDTIDLLQAGAPVTYTGVDAAGGFIWDIVGVGNRLVATFLDTPINPMGADFDGDGVVDEKDLRIWENNFGSTGVGQTMGDTDGDGDVDGMDLLNIQMDFGGPPSLLALSAVPEPSTLLLGLVAMACCPRRRFRG